MKKDLFSTDNINSKGVTDNLIACINEKEVWGKCLEYLSFKYLHSKTALITVKWGAYSFSTYVDNNETASDVLTRFELKANFKHADKYENHS